MKWLSVFMFFVSPAYAEVGAGSLLNLINLEKGQEESLGVTYVVGLERGIFWTNIWIKQRGNGDPCTVCPQIWALLQIKWSPFSANIQKSIQRTKTFLPG